MKGLLPSFVPKIVLPLILLASDSLAAEPTAFEVSGYITTVATSQGAWPGSTNVRQFAVAVDGSKVFIRCNAGAADTGVDYTEFGTDGTNGFQFDKTLLRARPGLRNDATLHIEPSPVPPPWSGMIQKVWLVYAGHLELKGNTNSFLKPQGSIRLREQPFDQALHRMLSDHLLLRTEWAFDEQEPHCLKMFVDYRDGKFATDRYSESIIPEEFMSGKTNSQMKVLSWTNVAGLHLPIHAQITTYVRDKGKPGHPLQESLIQSVTATNTAAGTRRQSFIPKLSSATRIVDYRFAQGPERPAEYLATNGVILHAEEEAWKQVQRQAEERK